MKSAWSKSVSQTVIVGPAYCVPAGFFKGTLKIGPVYKRDVQVKLFQTNTTSDFYPKLVSRLEGLRMLTHENVLFPDHHDYDVKEEAYLVAFSHRNQSLKDFVQSSLPLPTEQLELSKQILSGLTFLTEKNIFEVDLEPDQIHLFQGHQPCPSVRLSFDFKQFMGSDTSLFSTVEEEDLKKASVSIYFIFTGKENRVYELEDLHLIPGLEVRILIQALQHGLSAKEALKSPAFHTIGQKLEAMNKLNEAIKALDASNREKLAKGEATDETIFSDLEENPELLMGDQISWFYGLDCHLQKEFCLYGAGYNIASFADLLRFIRNLVAHAGQNPHTIMEVFGKSHVSSEEIFDYFSEKFPHFYLRLFHIHQKLLHKDFFVDDVYLKEYKLYENSEMKLLTDKGTSKVLPKNNLIHLDIEGEATICSLTIKPVKADAPSSLLYGEIVLDAVKEVLVSKWPSTKLSCISIQANGSKIFPKSKLLEGSTIKVIRHALLVNLPQISEEIEVEYPPKSTVSLIQSFSCKHFRDSGKLITTDNLKVYLNGVELSPTQTLESLAISAGYFMEVLHD